ncbi:hypothetical protein SDC9_184077 [bioreactor metagenome]|uniref:Uncharacterized protein n=1 Tax=bioreactor metagenome TaxID=1076179 RepID=A0A645HC10_9ZZZZ
MDDFRLFGIGVEVARNAVVKTHPDGNKHIALVGVHVGGNIAVHAQHSPVERMIGGDGGKSEDGGAEWDIAFL